MGIVWISALLFFGGCLADECKIQDVKCPKKVLIDIVLLVDTSGTISAIDVKFENTKKVLNDVIDVFDSNSALGPEGALFAVVQYSSKTETLFNFNQFPIQNPRDVLDSIHSNGTMTDIGGALGYVRTETFKQSNGARPGVTRLVILCTDGAASSIDTVRAEVALYAQENILLLVIGVEKNTGFYLPPDGIRFMDHVNASDPCSFQNVVSKMSNIICSDNITNEFGKGCVWRKRDVIILVDASSSQDDTNDGIKQFIKKLVDEGIPTIGTEGFRAGLDYFANGWDPVIRLSDASDKDTFDRLVDNASPAKSLDRYGSRLGAALQKSFHVSMSEEFGGRLNSEKFMIIITDGKASDETVLKNQVAFLNSLGVVRHVVTISPRGVSDRAKLNLQNLASKPEYVYTYYDFDDIVKLVPLISVDEKNLCPI